MFTGKNVDDHVNNEVEAMTNSLARLLLKPCEDAPSQPECTRNRHPAMSTIMSATMIAIAPGSGAESAPK
jgi:hypothetical protein